jgi:hypothetical protein
VSRRSDAWWRDEPDFFDSAAMRGRWAGGGARCYESHPPLVLGDTGLVIHGGSCGHPMITDADVYIGFDASMTFSRRHWPWLPGHEVLFRITDMQAPDDPQAFRQLVDWTAHRLLDGAKVHCGCVGGHGRTGTFLAALLKVMAGETDATAHVREHYCQKAVESAAQVAFLKRHFGIAPVPPAKGQASSRSRGPARRSSVPLEPFRDTGEPDPPAAKTGKRSGAAERIEPLPGVSSIWAKGRAK